VIKGKYNAVFCLSDLWWTVIAEKTLVVCDGSDTNWSRNGIRPDEETRDGCKAACEAEEGCAFIVWKPDKEKCLLHQHCDTFQNMNYNNRADILQLVSSSQGPSASSIPSASPTPSASLSPSTSSSPSATSSPSTGADACVQLSKSECKTTDGCDYSYSGLSKSKCEDKSWCDPTIRLCSSIDDVCVGISPSKCKNTDGCSYSYSGLGKTECEETDWCDHENKYCSSL